jgi:hypothetical protein
MERSKRGSIIIQNMSNENYLRRNVHIILHLLTFLMLPTPLMKQTKIVDIFLLSLQRMQYTYEIPL